MSYFFGALGATETFTLSESNYTGGYTVTSSATSVATAGVNGNIVTVTAQGNGAATITVTDRFGATTPIAITVTTAGISI